MRRRKLLALSAGTIPAMSGCLDYIRGEPDTVQIGLIRVENRVETEQTVITEITEEDKLIFEEEITLPASNEKIQEKDLGGTPTDPGVYKLTCRFISNPAEYETTFSYSDYPEGCYEIFPTLLSLSSGIDAEMFTKKCE